MSHRLRDAVPRKRVAFILFQLTRRNPAGSTMVEFIGALTRHYDVSVYATAIDDSLLQCVRFYRVPSFKRGGVVAQLTSSYLGQLLLITKQRLARRWHYDAVHTVDSESPFGDVVSFHNCHADFLRVIWRERLWASRRSAPGLLRDIALVLNFSLRILVERRNGRKARRVFALTERHARLLNATYGIPMSVIRVRPNYIQEHADSEPRLSQEVRATLRSRFAVQPDDVVAVFVAQGAWERKGLPLLLEALAQKVNSAVRLFVVGAGGVGEREAFGQLACDLGVDSRIRWLGHRDDVAEIMRVCDIFVHPSRYETFSLVSLEALAAGLPMIMTNVGGAAEVIEEGRNGNIVEHRSEALAAAIHSFASSPTLRASARDASLRIAARYERTRCVEAFVKDYQYLMESDVPVGPHTSQRDPTARVASP